MEKTAFCRATGFSARHVQRYIVQGLPCRRIPRKKGGRPRVLFEYERAIAWLSARGIVPPAAEQAAQNATVEAVAESGKILSAPAPKQVEHKRPIDYIEKDLLQQPGLLGALERLRLKEFTLSMRVQTMVASGASAGEVFNMQKNHSRDLQILSKTEFAAIAYRQKLGELCRFEDMAHAWEQVAIAIRNGVQGIASSLAPRLRGYLRDPDQLPEVRDLIAEHCRRALENVPAETPRRSDSETTDGTTASQTTDRGTVA